MNREWLGRGRAAGTHNSCQSCISRLCKPIKSTVVKGRAAERKIKERHFYFLLPFFFSLSQSLLSVSPLVPGLTLIPAPECTPLARAAFAGRERICWWVSWGEEGLSVGRMYCACPGVVGQAGGVREEVVAAVGWSWRTGRGLWMCRERSSTAWAGPRPRLVSRLLPPTGVTLTGPGEEDDRYPPPAVIGSCWAPPPPIRRVAFLSCGRVLRVMAPSTGLLAMGMGVLAMGRTTLVTIVGAMRTPTGVKLCWASGGGGWAMEREETPCPPPPFPSPPPAAACSVFRAPSLSSSPPSAPLFLFFSDPSSGPPPLPPPFPLAEEESEWMMEGEEEGREERATGWKPCWREERSTEIKGGKLICEVLLNLQ